MTRLSVSNIAWPHELRREIYAELASMEVFGVEIALTKIAPWDEITPQDVAIEADLLDSFGLSVSSYQALFFGRPDLQLLGNESSFCSLLDHTVRVADFAAQMSGGGPGVFGAPKNRIRGHLDERTAFDLGAERLRKLAEAVASTGFIIALEPAPVQYGGDFLNTEAACAAMVRTVDHSALRLHLDGGCLALAGEDPAEAVASNFDILGHVHVSQPHLVPIDSGDTSVCASLITALAACNYKGWAAIEMRETSNVRLALQSAIAKFLR